MIILQLTISIMSFTIFNNYLQASKQPRTINVPESKMTKGVNKEEYIKAMQAQYKNAPQDRLIAYIEEVLNEKSNVGWFFKTPVMTPGDVATYAPKDLNDVGAIQLMRLNDLNVSKASNEGFPKVQSSVSSQPGNKVVVNESLGRENSISDDALIGIKCKCAWGTSKPTVTMPTLLQGKLAAMALAMGFANNNSSLK